MKILLIKTSSMGDLIHTFPALTEAQQHYPELKIDWLVEETFKTIPTWHNAVNKVIPLALRRWRKNWYKNWQNQEIPQFITNLRQENYDYIIDAQGLLKSAVLNLIAKKNPKCKICGYNWQSIREPLASLVYNYKHNISRQQHAINRIRILFAKSLNYQIFTNDINIQNQINYGIRNNIAKLTLSLYKNLNDKLLNHACNFILQTTNNYLVFIHATSREDKHWNNTKWNALCNIASQENYTILLPWGNAKEYQQAKNIALNTTNVVVLPKLTLDELAIILLHAHKVVAVDTGLGHLSSALDIPTISLYGPTLPTLIGSVGKHTKHCIDLHNLTANEVWECLNNTIV